VSMRLKKPSGKGPVTRVKRYLDSRADDNHERWLVSYADFMTLLFAFFVVMYAISSVNEGKYRVVGQAIGSALGVIAVPGGQPVPGGGRGANSRGALSGDALARHRERMSELERTLGAALAPLAAEGQVRLLRNARGLTVDIGAGALFAPGQATLRQEARDVLVAVAKVVRVGEEPLEVEGHTDDTPIYSSAFPSNWELSATRASTVVRLLVEQGVAPARMAAIGRAQFQPVESNDTAEGRARNRRVSLTVVASAPAAPANSPARAIQSFPPMEFPVGR
jgi:chemotaxis protein MotB